MKRPKRGLELFGHVSDRFLDFSAVFKPFFVSNQHFFRGQFRSADVPPKQNCSSSKLQLTILKPPERLTETIAFPYRNTVPTKTPKPNMLCDKNSQRWEDKGPFRTKNAILLGTVVFHHSRMRHSDLLCAAIVASP